MYTAVLLAPTANAPGYAIIIIIIIILGLGRYIPQEGRRINEETGADTNLAGRMTIKPSCKSTALVHSVPF